jgi:hypothetical protein
VSRANEQAFPGHMLPEHSKPPGGLTIREHFAGLAMAALIMRGYVRTEVRTDRGELVGTRDLYQQACEHADQQLAALAKPGSNQALIEERRAAWESITKHIKLGHLQGNGCDETAQRNGLVLAANILRARLDEVLP